MLSIFSAASVVAGLALGHKRLLAAWIPTSDVLLTNAEKRMLECVKTPLKHVMVPAGGENIIHTIVTETDDDDKKPVLVLVHGFGGGVGLWANNMDALASRYKVYAIDVLGFGRSSRPPFRGRTAADGQAFFVESLEQWRKSLNLTDFVLLGHSLGGYIAASYTLQYGSHVDRLILAAPFGVAERPKVELQPGEKPKTMPFRYRALRWFAEKSSPQALVRVAGPFGPHLVTRLRGRYDQSRYQYTDDRVSDYVYHLTASPGSAEYAFMALQSDIGFAKEPLYSQMPNIRVPITFIYGDRDFITFDWGYKVKEIVKVPCDVHVIPGAAHHAYATHPDEFHAAVFAAVRRGDAI